MSADPRVPELLAAWRARRAQGETISPEDLCRDCPDLAPVLRRVIGDSENETGSAPPVADAELVPLSEADTAAVGNAATHPEVPLPQKVGEYIVIKVLGKGGMGTVYLAHDPGLGRRVAVKVLRPKLAADPSYRSRFAREAKAAARVQHDYVVPIYHVGDADPPYLVMPALEGETLDAVLKRGDRLPLREVLRVGRQVAEGLAAAHSAGLVHRDVKPANVWLEAPAGRVKLLDFGLAREVEGGADSLTHHGTILGTPAYMAPEQAAGERVDYRADLFSLGVMLYELTTGTNPFWRPGTMAILHALANHDPPAPLHLDPTLPPDLSDLIQVLTDRRKEARVASAREVADQLAALERGEPGPSAIVPLPPPRDPLRGSRTSERWAVFPPPPPPPPPHRGWLTTLLLPALGVMAGAFVVLAALKLGVRLWW